MKRWKYLLAAVVPASGFVWLWLAYDPEISKWPPYALYGFLVAVFILSVSICCKWAVLATTFFLLLVLSIVGKRWRYRLKYLLALFVAVSWFVSGFLTYLMPAFAARLPWIALACWIPLLFFLLSALFRRRWKALAIFSAAWLLAVLCIVKPESVERLRFWLLVQGFRIHAFPAEEYLSRCRLTEFVENNVKQTLGQCESWGLGDYTAYVVFYDSTGEIAAPASHRTPEWKDAMYNYSPKDVLREKEARAKRLSGGFYRVSIYQDEWDGD